MSPVVIEGNNLHNLCMAPAPAPCIAVSLFSSGLQVMRYKLKVIKSLHDDETIYLIKPDKGNGVVIINRTDYKARMQDILSNNTKFNFVDNTALRETLTKETKITNLLKELKQDEIIS